MPTSEARIIANRQNAQLSTGPSSTLGKEKSRANSYKHGLTGAGIVMPEEDAVEVERRTKALQDEMKPPGEAGRLLVRQVATLSVRMERSFKQETAAISDRVRKVMEEFEAPEGVDEATAEKLRIEAGTIALFDPSKEACLARRYESADRRNFFRALNDLRQLQKAAQAAEPAAVAAAGAKANRELLGSFSQMASTYAEVEGRALKPAPVMVSKGALPPFEDDFANLRARVDVPISIGRRR